MVVGGLADLPFSIWEKILIVPEVKATDILSFCSTCKQLRDVLLSNSAVWRAKMFQQWPALKKQIENGRAQDWFKIYRERHSIISVVSNTLNEMAAKFIHAESTQLPDKVFEPLVLASNRCDLGRIYLIDELRYILNEVPPHLRLTHKFYTAGAIRILVQDTLMACWHRWLGGPQELEMGTWLFAQWFQPASYLDEEWLTNQLDRMAEETKQKLSEINKRHPLLRQHSIDHANLRQTIWSSADTREIIEALSIVFAMVHGFRGNVNDYYNEKNSYMNEVIQSKLGIPITLCILYHAVARRLGVYCAPVNFPGHFLLKYLDNPELSESQKYTYVDVFNSCRLMREDQVWATHAPANLRFDRSYFAIPDAISVLTRMTNNIGHVEHAFHAVESVVRRSAWELGVALRPSDFDIRLGLARKYFRLDINFDKIIDLMKNAPEPLTDVQRVQQQHFIQMAQTRLVTFIIYHQESVHPPKLRSEHQHVQWSVGEILRHKQYHYTCAIIGWDPVCAASDSWKNQMGVQNLPRQDQQPFYHVLVNDGTNRYAAEENLIFEPHPVSVTHAEVGKFFDEFCGTHYKMNSERQREYPDDDGATIRFVQTAYGETVQNETGDLQ